MNMLAKKAKKGFTIVELVIVIAVIAILAAVLIPTFTSVVSNANESAAMQESRNEWTNYLAEVAGEGEYTNYKYAVVYKDGAYVFYVTNGEFDTKAYTDLNMAYSDDYTDYDVAELDEYGYTSASSNVNIYNMTIAAADAAESAAAAAAASSISGSKYYAKVTDSDENVFYFYLVYGTEWTASVSSEAEDANYTSNTTDISETDADYTVIVVA